MKSPGVSIFTDWPIARGGMLLAAAAASLSWAASRSEISCLLRSRDASSSVRSAMSLDVLILSGL